MNILMDIFPHTFLVKAGFTLNILYNQTLLRNFYSIYAALFILFLIYFFSGIGILGGFVNYLARGVLIVCWIFSSRLFRMIGGLFVDAGGRFPLGSCGGMWTVMTD